MTQHALIHAVQHFAEVTLAVPLALSVGVWTTRPSVRVPQGLWVSRGLEESVAPEEVRVSEEWSGEAPAPAPCALLTPVVWTPSVMLAATEVGTPGLSAPARGVTGVMPWSSVGEENASVTASALTTRPALTTGARIPARARTQAVALTLTAGL